MTPPVINSTTSDTFDYFCRQVVELGTLNVKTLALIEETRQKVHSCAILESGYDAGGDVERKRPVFVKVASGEGSAGEDSCEKIETWMYEGEKLEKESLFGHLIDLRLANYVDIKRLTNDFSQLGVSYSRFVVNEPETREALSIILRNQTLLQTALENLLGLCKSRETNNNNNGSIGTISESTEGSDANEIMDFGLISALSCKKSLSVGRYFKSADMRLLSRKYYYAGCSPVDHNFKVWNLTDCEVVGIFPEIPSVETFTALTFYEQKGVPFVASCRCLLKVDKDDGVEDEKGTIELWNLHEKTLVGTLGGHDCRVYTMATYTKEGRTFLISEDEGNTIKQWDLEQMSMTSSTHVDDDLGIINIFQKNKEDGALLARGKRDVFELHDSNCVPVASLGGHAGHVTSLLKIRNNDRLFLASASVDKSVRLWDLESYDCVRRREGLSGVVVSFEVIRCNGKMCLVCASAKKALQIFSLEDFSLIKAWKSERKIRRIMAMQAVRDDLSAASSTSSLSTMDPCLLMLTFDRNEGTIEFWME